MNDAASMALLLHHHHQQQQQQQQQKQQQQHQLYHNPQLLLSTTHTNHTLNHNNSNTNHLQQQQQQQAADIFPHSHPQNQNSILNPAVQRAAAAEALGAPSPTHRGLPTPPPPPPGEPYTVQTTTAVPARGAASSTTGAPSRYESQKRRDWNTFGQYLRNSRPPLPLAKCTGEHVLQFLHYLDQFGKTKVHASRCPYFGVAQPTGACDCPLRQAWGSLDALIGRLRAAFEENGGKPESNPFGAKSVRIYLREVRDLQAKARGIAYEKKKRKKPPTQGSATATASSSSKSSVDSSCSNSFKGVSAPPSSSVSCRNITYHHPGGHLEPAPPTPAAPGSGSSASPAFLIPGCY